MLWGRRGIEVLRLLVESMAQLDTRVILLYRVPLDGVDAAK